MPNVTFVYLSSKSELATERWRNVLESEIYQESLIGVVVDEVHWGEAGKKPFFFLFLHSCTSRSLLAPCSIALRNTRKTLGKEIAQ